MSAGLEDIGYLKAKADESDRKFEKLFTHMEAQTKILTRLDTKFEGHLAQTQELNAKVKRIDSDLGGIKAFRNKMYGGVTAITVVVSGSVAKIIDFFQ